MRTHSMPATLRHFIAALLLTMAAEAQIPRTISYQGVLADAAGNLPADGNHTLQVSLFEALSGGAAIYSETQTIPVVRGIFNMIIGTVTPLPGTLRFDRAYFLEVQINGSTLGPRTPLTAVPYAMRAATAELADGLSPTATGVVRSINGTAGSLTLTGDGGTTISRSNDTITIRSSGTGGTGIQGVANADGSLALTTPNGPVAGIAVAAGGITTVKLANDAVTAAKLADNAVTSQKIVDGSISGDDINSSAALAIGKLTTSGNVSIGTTTSTSRLVVQAAGTSAPGSAVNVINSAGGPLLYVRNDGNVGIGTTTPMASLEVAGESGLRVSGGLLTLSSATTPAGAIIPLPPNRSVITIVDDGQFSSNIITMPPGTAMGQILIISNEDSEATSGGAVIASRQTRMYVSTIGGFWRPIE